MEKVFFIAVIGAVAFACFPVLSAHPETTGEIRTESLRPNFDPEGRPLPLAGHWHANHFSLAFQVGLIRRGHHILPFIEWPRAGAREFKGLEQVKKWRLPLTIIHGNQWVSRFWRREKFKKLSPEESPLMLTADGQTKRKISPFGPVQPWEDLGVMLVTSPGISKLQEDYPRPPLVLFVSNNEPPDLRWHQAEKSRRYLDLYGKGRSDMFKRRVVANGWIRRYRAMFRGMRAGLKKKAWKANSIILPYGGAGPDHYGRPDIGDGGWLRWSNASPDRVAWGWYAWEGAMGSYYDNDWEPKKNMFNLWSCQMSFMNNVFMKKEALSVNPDFWFELIYWDGGQDKAAQYKKNGYDATSPARYRGWVQYGMWLLLPRAAREWESSTSPHESYWHNMKEIIRAVDLVHVDPVLKRFWRHGHLVPNTEQHHPFNTDLLEKYEEENRWFRLETSLDPERPWKLTTPMPIWALARRIGQKPSREWLIYAHAPLGDKKGVEVTVPEYKKITMDVEMGGSFVLVSEKTESVRPVGDLAQVEVAPVNLPE
ncbi:MAG: hypothetical protein ACLFWL_05865 [Candidatus Brocadiia bacterium]